MKAKPAHCLIVSCGVLAIVTGLVYIANLPGPTSDATGTTIRWGWLVLLGGMLALWLAGRVVGYRCEWHRVNFPRPQSVISPAEAARRRVANASYELKYHLPRTDDGRPCAEARPVYFLAADYLQLLAESGLLPPPEKFAPSAPVTSREAVRVLVAAARRYYGTEEVPAVPSFRDVAPGDADFGTVETAAIPNRITSSFVDTAPLSGREQNYIGLAYGLGFMRGDGTGKFRPDKPVTWEELAASVIRALPLLEGGREW